MHWRITMRNMCRLVVALCALAGCAEPENPGVTADAAGTQCPPWVYYPADTHSNAESPYLGCDNRANLEQMVARPADLDSGRPLGPASGARESLGVETYEQGKIKGFSSEAIQGPSIVLPGGTSGAQ